jgi:hypothetical protein
VKGEKESIEIREFPLTFKGQGKGKEKEDAREHKKLEEEKGNKKEEEDQELPR